MAVVRPMKPNTLSMFASLGRKGHPQLTRRLQPHQKSILQLAAVSLAAVIALPALAIEGERGASVDLQGATITLHAAPTMAPVLLSESITLADDERLVLLSIDLREGWKTYWRLPGRFGLAPAFDWQGSSNISNVTTHFPVPLLFEEGDGLSVGYDAPTVWAVVIEVDEPARPVDIHLSLDIGLCAVLCLPEQAELAASLDDLAEGEPVSLADIFVLKDQLASTSLSMERLAFENDAQGLQLTVEDAFNRTQFAVAEDDQGRHTLLRNDGSSLRGSWQWPTPIKRITIIEPGNQMLVYEDDPSTP